MVAPAALTDRLQDAAEAAREAGLRYVSDRRPGITWLKNGDGFHYRTADEKPLREPETLGRIKRLAIPPVWTDVWICPLAQGHIQATGRDARGRKQYRYHPDWQAARLARIVKRLQDLDGATVDVLQKKAETACPR